MARATIDFGIHLGGDYCVMARMVNGQVEVISTPEGAVLTPSVVWLDRKNQVQVGKPAALQLDKDTENTAEGFLTRLGTTDLYQFKRDGRSLTAEELVAETYKALLGNARQQTGEEVLAAVVSIPAVFEISQCRAVERAARQAGLQQVLLLNELEAAVYAHTFYSQAESGTWLVFNLGPYAFETAVIQGEPGNLNTLSFLADSNLGDRLITWAIVDKLLAPAAVRDFHLSEFQRKNPHWRKAFAKLDSAVETARIKVTGQYKYTISFDILCIDDNGEPVPFEYDLNSSQVTMTAAPILKRCAEMSLQALAQANLSKQAINWVIPIGEATSIPMVEEYLNHPQMGLGLPMIFYVDPLTVTAQGAAIFAGSQLFDLPAPVSEVEPVESVAVENQPVNESPTPGELIDISPPESEPVVAEVTELLSAIPATAPGEETPPPPPVNREELAAWLLEARTNAVRVLETGRLLGDKGFERRLKKIIDEIDQVLQDLNHPPARNS